MTATQNEVLIRVTADLEALKEELLSRDPLDYDQGCEVASIHAAIEALHYVTVSDPQYLTGAE